MHTKPLLLACCLACSWAAAATEAELQELTVARAVLLALERNTELAVERLTPEILDTEVLEERALFDSLLEVELGREHVKGRDLSASGNLFDYDTAEWVGEASWTQLFPTGTSLELGASTEVEDASSDGQQLVAARLGMTVTQPLLRGTSKAANVARVRSARLDVLASRWEVWAFTEIIVALLEQTYWDYAAAQLQLEIYDEAIALAEGFLAEIRQRVELGLLARSQTVAADAEIALRHQERVDAQGARESAQALLLSFLDLPQHTVPLRLVEPLTCCDDVSAEVEQHVTAGLRDRADLNQARALVQRGEIEVLRTRHGLLPRLDFFVTLGRTGYRDAFGRAWDHLDDEHSEVTFGLSLGQSLGRRAERAVHEREALTQRQTAEALRNLERLVQVDVRVAHVEVARARAKVIAVAATRALDEEKLGIENERFDAGLASSFQVARAQRDLVRRRIEESEALAEYRKGLVELYRLDGSLLKRRGITIPLHDTAGGP